jgi:hypothetical protein
VTMVAMGQRPDPSRLHYRCVYARKARPRPGGYPGWWQTASTLLPSGSRTKVP